MSRAQNGASGPGQQTREIIKKDLQHGALLCASHYLLASGQWASTALLSFRELAVKSSDIKVATEKNGALSRWQSPPSKPTNSTPLSVFKVPFPPATQVNTPLATAIKEPTENSETNFLLDPTLNSIACAMSLQRYKEAWILAEGKAETVPLCRFLHFYAKFLHLERLHFLLQNESALDHGNDAYFCRLYGKLRQDVFQHLHRSHRKESSGALHFLYGKLLRREKKIDEAIKAFVEAITLEPMIIEAWTELADCMENRAEIVRVGACLPDHWIQSYFLGRAYGNVGLIDRAFSSFERFQSFGFAGHPDLNSAMGKLTMTIDPQNSLCFMEASRLFNPVRMNDVDSYSHLLFILDDHVRMRILAEEIIEAGRFTAECSIALGNFYGLLGDHDKAVANFYKALRYNPGLHHVWTLIGHEQVELKQTELAMRSYSNAVEADPKEYRAWYGLGQTMEILRAHASALFYFKRAFENCPSDTRMLLALGDTFHILDNYSDAEMCYWRAYQVAADTVVLVRLARLFEKLGRYGRAAELYIKYTADVQAESAENPGTSLADRDDAEDLGHAYLYLSKYYLLHRLFDNAFEEAQAAEIFREVKDEAHAMQKQISRMQAETGAGAEAEGLPLSYEQIDPARLGFPLWKETVVIEALPAVGF